jgi:hypothetical protein
MAAPEPVGERTDHRTEQRSADPGSQGPADRTASPLGRGLDDQPDHAPGPRARATDALDEARRVE